jgi:hypothetical protein
VVDAAGDTRGAAVYELLDVGTSDSFEIYYQLSRHVPSPVGERDPNQDGRIDLPGVPKSERELIGLFAAP